MKLIDIKKETSNLELDGNNNVAFIGAIGIHKGSNILRELVKTKKSINFSSP